MTKVHTLNIGIAPREVMRERTMAIASGRYKPDENEPKIWFTSLSALAQVLSEKNMLLIELIRNSQPSSLSELAEISGREKSNLSRTLKTMQQFGLVHLTKGRNRKTRPQVTFDDLNVVWTSTPNKSSKHREQEVA